MKILCVYHTDDGDFFAQDPIIELEDHHVVAVHSFSQAILEIIESEKVHQSFDIILSDLYLPVSTVDRPDQRKLVAYGYVLMSEMKYTMTRGLGLFVPSDFSIKSGAWVNATQECDVVVVSKDYYDFVGRRDWKQMLLMVEEKIEQLDESL